MAKNYENLGEAYIVEGTEILINDKTGGLACPTFTYKWWGYELTYYNDEYCGKMLNMKKDGETSLHLHAGKHETLIVASGKLELTIVFDKKTQVYILEPGDAYIMIPGLPHKLKALEDTIVVEASTKDKINDSVRIE